MLPKFLISSALILSLFGLSWQPAQAVVYDSGLYDQGTFNQGASPPTPTPAPQNNNSSSSNSSNSSPGDGGGGGCSASAPTVAPDLFQIDASQKSVTLYITKPSGNVNKYNIHYGYDQNVTQFSATVDITSNTWITPVVINQLAPNTVYYFQAKAVNDCTPGPGSASVASKTTNNAKSISKFFKNSNIIQKTFSRIKSTVAKATTKSKTAPQPTTTQPQTPNRISPTQNNPSAPRNTVTAPPPAPASNPAPAQNSGFFSNVAKTVKSWFGF